MSNVCKVSFGKMIAQCLEEELKIKLKKEAFLREKEKVDYLYDSERTRLIIEIESRRQDQVNNVVKSWKILEEAKERKHTYLLHFFSGKYWRKNSKYQNAVFVGKKMEEARVATYLPVLLKAEPPRGSRGVVSITDEERRNVVEKIHEICEAISL